VYNFIIIAVLDADVAKRPARHDLKVPFHCDTQGIEPKLVQHFSYAQRPLHPAVLAVHANSKASIEAHAGSQ
jgi:hypothetical protein